MLIDEYFYMLVISWLEGKEDIFKECREKFKSTYIVSTRKQCTKY